MTPVLTRAHPRVAPRCRGRRARPSRRDCRYGLSPRASLGYYAASAVGGFATITQVGTTANGGGAAAGTTTVTLAQAATAGNLIVVGVGGSNANVTSPTVTAPAYTRAGGGWNGAAGGGGGAHLFLKVAAGGETSVVITFTGAGNVTATWTAFELSGVDPASIPLGPAAPAAYTVDTGGATHTVNSPTRVTTVSPEFLITIVGGRCQASGTVTPTFGGGATAFYTAASGRVSYCIFATELVATSGTSVTHTCSVNNSQGNPVNVIGTVALAPAAL